ncbi:hypothetical protein CRE_23675 [Caenorhabditis remanei]|uniref:Uncharacterized protein n=1 Tax=Caenorhabditis remanei TaxID=31234 RepID=E3N497_CAERE|nr:hypothetical protein CRE_23675 [Caenorhabditis remanei]
MSIQGYSPQNDRCAWQCLHLPRIGYRNETKDNSNTHLISEMMNDVLIEKLRYIEMNTLKAIGPVEFDMQTECRVSEKRCIDLLDVFSK